MFSFIYDGKLSWEYRKYRGLGENKKYFLDKKVNILDKEI